MGNFWFFSLLAFRISLPLMRHCCSKKLNWRWGAFNSCWLIMAVKAPPCGLWSKLTFAFCRAGRRIWFSLGFPPPAVLVVVSVGDNSVFAAWMTSPIPSFDLDGVMVRSFIILINSCRDVVCEEYDVVLSKHYVITWHKSIFQKKEAFL